ncbi:hypothetical protein [Bacillus sp. JCM 19034]|uniref:hypothetical protein n=1 Tax=Bacillus sp. JCM 19034 TaxID=1481928 RepID=UPI000781A235|nr:hypothetical protein [Bacillus sp. JCM 19034]
MYSLILFVHVVSALFLGCFLAFPLAINTLFSRTSNELITSLKTILAFTRAGHYALVLIMVSGGWMVIGYSSYPSKYWVTLSTFILILIGGLIGMVNKNIKQIIFANDSKQALLENMVKLKWYGWITFISILTAVFVMTNRSLFS